MLTFLMGILTNVATGALPEEWKPYLWLSWVPLVLCFVIVVALTFIRERETTSAATSSRSRMLDKVEAFWVKGILEKSLDQIARIELGFQYDPDAVLHPWETILQRPNRPDQSIPRGKSAIAVFDDLGGELLILGAPGAGKTTLLLELARDLIARAER